MPAEIVTMFDCASCFGVYEVASRSGKGHHTVSWSGESQPHCTCMAFKFRHECWHADFVWHNACMFNPQWNPGNNPINIRPKSYTYNAVVEGEHCPNCGGPMVAVKRAV